MKKVFTIKQREEVKSMLVLLGSFDQLQFYISDVSEIVLQLIEIADKPITIIYPGAQNLAQNLISTDGTVGIRIPKDPFCQKLLKKFKKPVVST